MNTLVLLISCGVLVASLIAVELGSFWKALGFKEEGKAILQCALAIAVLGFALFLSAYPRVTFKARSTSIDFLY